MKKILSVLLIAVLIVSFAACSKKGTVSSNEDGDVKSWYFNSKEDNVDEMFKDAKDTANPEGVYSSLTYTEEMLHGAYAINDLEKDISKIKDDFSYKTITLDKGSYSITSVPVAVYAGARMLPDNESEFRQVTDREVATLRFLLQEGKLGSVPCAYEINGNKIKYTVLKNTGNNGSFSYELTDVVFEYTFSLKGIYLTLSDGTDSVTLTGYTFTDNNKGSLTCVRAYSAEKTPLIDNLDFFVSQQDSIINFAVDRNGEYYNNSACKITDDGKATIYLAKTDSDGKETKFLKQYTYIAQCSGSSFFNSFSLILFDGDKTYYYNDSDTDREARLMQEDGTDVNAIDEAKLKEIADKKKDLFDDLKKEFKNNGIEVSINRATGEINMDATVLFGGDSAEITKEGKAFLDKFVKAYTGIIFNEKYKDFIAKTVVEGHVAPLSGSTYESGLPLSEKRAKNVKEYCVSSDSKLADSIEAKGLSNSRPIYDSDGNVDLNASRRVSFKFIVNVGN